jgi:hypothetical protein
VVAEQAMSGRAGRNYWWIAPIYAQSENRLPSSPTRTAVDQSVYKSNESELTMTLANGAVIWFKGAENADSLYGEDVYAAVIDEATRVKEESWHAVRSTLTATRGPIRIIGNVKGRRIGRTNSRAVRSRVRADMHYAKLTAYDAVEAGVLDAAEVEDAKRMLPELRCSMSSTSPSQATMRATRSALPPSVPASRRSPTDAPVAWGWDLAKSQDYTVGIALDRDRGAPVALSGSSAIGSRRLWISTQATGRTKALVDSTGVGDPILERLQKTTPNTYEGFKFTQPSKQQLMEGLAVAIQQRRVTFPDGPIVNELETFEYVYTRTGVRYSAPDGLHDDCVMGLALAVKKMERPERKWGAV